MDRDRCKPDGTVSQVAGLADVASAVEEFENHELPPPLSGFGDGQATIRIAQLLAGLDRKSEAPFFALFKATVLMQLTNQKDSDHNRMVLITGVAGMLGSHLLDRLMEQVATTSWESTI